MVPATSMLVRASIKSSRLAKPLISSSTSSIRAGRTVRLCLSRAICLEKLTSPCNIWSMKIREVLLDTLIGTRLFEMAFERKLVIDRLMSLQDQINSHAIKIIVWPDAQEVPHWKHELTAWGDNLASMWLKGRPSRPMGFD